MINTNFPQEQNNFKVPLLIQRFNDLQKLVRKRANYIFEERLTSDIEPMLDKWCEGAEHGFVQDGASQFEVRVCHGASGVVKAHDAVLQIRGQRNLPHGGWTVVGICQDHDSTESGFGGIGRTKVIARVSWEWLHNPRWALGHIICHIPVGHTVEPGR